MTPNRRVSTVTTHFDRARGICALVAAMLLAAGCRPQRATGWQGYVEGDFVYVASPLAGRVESLAVEKGTRVAEGAPLFRLEQTAELATRSEAAERVRQAQARLDDLRKGQRPQEILAIQQRLAQANAAAELSRRELARSQGLRKSDVISDLDLDRARLGHEANARRVDEIAAQLATAQLGARTDSIVAAEADLAAAKAALDRAEWSVAQKSVAAPAAALIHDRLYREGEFVPAGTPVVALLPPGNIKIRFFLSETELAGIKAGDSVKVSVSGVPAPVAARVSYLATKPEYTPPVLYNRENRSKLVFMAEAVPVDPSTAKDLHPGQPVDVRR